MRAENAHQPMRCLSNGRAGLQVLAVLACLLPVLVWAGDGKSKARQAGATPLQCFDCDPDPPPPPSPNIAPSVTLVAPTNNQTFSTGNIVAMTAAASDSDGSIQRVEFFVDGTKIGEDTTSPYDSAWTSTAGNHTLTAKAYDNLGAVATSGAVSIVVSTPPPLHDAVFVGQSVPTTMIAGQSYAVSVQIQNTGSATWSLVDGYKLGAQNPHDNTNWGTGRVGVAGSVTNSQITTFNFTATAPVTPGIYNFQWRMLQEGVTWFGASTSNVVITVNANNAPSVSLTTPINGQTFQASASIGLTASASDSDGSIQRVEFFVDGTKIGEDNASPYNFAWASTVGSHTLTAKAYDNLGAVAMSAPAIISVNNPSNVIGNIDGVAADSQGNYQLTGWACSTGLNQSIDVHLYVGGGWPSGTFVGGYLANQPSETGVANACQAQGTNYRFAIALTLALRQQHGGKAIYLHGISPVGGSNNLLWQSGTFTVPPPPPPPLLAAVTRRYVYDAHQRLCKVIEPETGATVLSYDGADNIQWSASGLVLPDINACNEYEAGQSGRRVDRSYDQRNRIRAMSFPDHNGDQVWDYEADGLPRQVTASNDGGSTSVITAYSYNRRRLLSGESVQQPGWYTWSIGYGYNANGHLTGQSYPTGLYVDYAPNALGQATRAGSFAQNVTYYPNGAIQQFTYGNGLVHTMTQNTRQLPSRSRDGSSTLDYEYGYDANANVSYIGDLIQGSHYSRWMDYDGLGRLASAGSCSFGGDCYHRFTYDLLDNIKSWKLPGVKDYANYYYEPDTNRLTSIQNSAGASIIGFGYDVQGNLANKNGVTYTFDYGNRLRGVSDKEMYRYDAKGRRILSWRPANGGQLTLSHYSSPGQLLYQQKTETTLASEHIYLSGSLIATREWNWLSNVYATKYQHTDALGSPVAVTNETGQVIDRTQYESFGAAINKPTYDGIGYTGHVMDAATGLIYMQQRYYDPSIGRFSSVDPVAVRPVGDNFNRYWYANNNPYKFTDLDGRETRISFVRDTYTNRSITSQMTVTSDQTDKSFNGFALEDRHAGPQGNKNPLAQGSYGAFVRTDGIRGFRIELKDTPDFRNVQVHAGNDVDDVMGCFAVGTSRSEDYVVGSKAAMNQIQSIVKADGSGKITVVVQGRNKAPTPPPKKEETRHSRGN